MQRFTAETQEIEANPMHMSYCAFVEGAPPNGTLCWLKHEDKRFYYAGETRKTKLTLCVYEADEDESKPGQMSVLGWEVAVEVKGKIIGYYPVLSPEPEITIGLVR